MNVAIEKGLSLVEAGEIEKGIQHLHRFLETANHEEKLMIAELFMNWGLVTEAKPIIDELLVLYPDEGQLYVMAAEIEIDNENEEEALDYLNEINETDAAYIQALVLGADLLQMQGLDEAAEQKLLKAKQLAPEEGLLDLGLGQFYGSIGEYKKAIPYLEKALHHNEEIHTHMIQLELADALSHTGQFERALEHYEIGLKERVELHALFSYAYTAFRLENYPLAIAKWSELKKLDPDYPALYLHLAQAYEHENLMDESWRIAKEGLEVDEYNKELLVYAAKIAMKRNDPEQMESLLQAAIAIDPGYMDAIALLTRFYFHQERYEAVIELLEECIRVGEDDPQFEWDLGAAKKKLDLYDDALTHYGAAYTSFKDTVEFLEEYSYFLLECGQLNQAKVLFKEILAIDPTNDYIENELLRLENEE